MLICPRWAVRQFQLLAYKLIWCLVRGHAEFLPRMGPVIFRQVPHDVAAGKKPGDDEADTGNMLQAKQRFLTEFTMAPRHAKTQDEKPKRGAGENTAHADHLGGERVVHPVVRH